MDKLFVREDDLLTDAYRLAVKVFRSGFEPTFIVGLWRGGSIVGIAVQECLQYLGIQSNHISVRTSYRGFNDYQSRLAQESPEIRIHNTHYLLENLNYEDRLLIVDDVFATGLNVDALIERLQQRLRDNMPQAVRTAVVWNKPAQHRTDLKPDYSIHQTDRWLVLPYELNGLSMDEIREHRPYLVAAIERWRNRGTSQ